QMAATPDIPEGAAEWHISHILAELGAASRAAAVAIALREGLLEPEEQPLPGKSATDLTTRRAHRAHASRDDRIIRFGLFGLHLGQIRIGRSRRDVAQTEAKPLGGEAGEARGRNGAERGER